MTLGFVNAHTHVYSGLGPFGMPVPEPPPRDFLEILALVWWRLDRALDAPALRASARWYVADALLHGTTTLIDHHESPAFIEGSLDVIADACDELGIRSLLTYGATERNGGREEGRRGLAECARFVRENRRPRVRGLVGLHASVTVSDETIEEAARLCADLDVATHVHVAEDPVDVRDAHERCATGPLARLFARGALPRGSILAHGVHLGVAEVRDAEEHGLWFVQNPRSNRGNRVGYPVALAASRHVALGTDGYPSDLRAELEALRELAAEFEPATPQRALAERLRAGRDLVELHFGEHVLAEDAVEWPDAGEPEPHAAGGAVAAVRTSRTSRAARVVVGGREVVRDGRLLTGDFAAIESEARAEAARLWKRMEAL